MAREMGWLALAAGSAVMALVCLRSHSSRSPRVIQSPRHTLLPKLSQEEVDALPYAPDDLPGGRYVETPHGQVRVYEWGPENGRKVLFVHGIATPAVALGSLAEHISARGCRVMLYVSLFDVWRSIPPHSATSGPHDFGRAFVSGSLAYEGSDLFGRGYSDSPVDQHYSAALFVSQMMHVLAASPLPWLAASENGCFDLVGYSLGGGIAAHFARYHIHLLRSLILVAPCGILRTDHIGCSSQLIYNAELVPQSLRQWLARRRLTPAPCQGVPTVAGKNGKIPVDSTMRAERAKKHQKSNSDASGGSSFDSALISLERGCKDGKEARSAKVIPVTDVLSWQLDHHEGFVPAYMNTMRDGPIYHEHAVWTELGGKMKSRRQMAAGKDDEGRKDEILFVFGTSDLVIDMSEVTEDAERTIGRESMRIAAVDAGHELPITKSFDIAQHIWDFWN